MRPLKAPGEGSTVYRGKAGQWGFLIHRIAGLMVFAFLLLHIVDVSTINVSGGQLYDYLHDLYRNGLFRLFTVGLMAGLLFHSLNGLRIVLVDFFPGAISYQRQMLAVVGGLTLVGSLVGGWIIMEPFVSGTLGIDI